jgi:ADP-heptose:LPS heptosyltransferase
MSSQTIIFHKPTGKIITVLENRYISRRSDLRIFAPNHPLREVAFFYEHQPIDISTAEDHIKQISAGNPPVVVSPAGEVKSFATWSSHRRNQISAAGVVLCHFEGGMGDQILQCEALHQFYEIFPDKKINVTAARPYYDIVKNVQGIKNLYPKDAALPHIKPDFTFDMHTQYISDPRGELYGKASLYGASLGLKSVHKNVILKIPPHTISPITAPELHGALKTPNPRIGIHIRSGSGHGKSWNTEPAEKLALLFINSLDAQIFLFGISKDWQLNHPSAVRVDQRYSWLQTAAVISQLNLLYCIDSGPMHLARALGTKHIILWGGTSYKDILGREKLPHDERLDLPCINQLCYDCPKGNPVCMTGHDPTHLFEKGVQIVSPPPTNPPNIHSGLGKEAP